MLVGGPGDFTALLGPGLIGWALLAAGVGGLVGMARAGLRTEAGLVVAVAGLAALVARLGATWPTLQAVAAERAAPFAVAALAIPAAWLAARWTERTALGPLAGWAAAGLPLLLGWTPLTAGLGLNLDPLPRGLTHEQEQLVAALQQHTTTEARILFEEPDTSRPGWNWTALLPVLTDRAYLGGLDPDAGVEHAFCAMRDGQAQRPAVRRLDALRAVGVLPAVQRRLGGVPHAGGDRMVGAGPVGEGGRPVSATAARWCCSS